jgi:hypothetical protein
MKEESPGRASPGLRQKSGTLAFRVWGERMTRGSGFPVDGPPYVLPSGAIILA